MSNENTQNTVATETTDIYADKPYMMYDYDLSKFQGYTNIKFKVKGYWSHEVINIYVEKDTFSEDLKIRVSHSCGGRDEKEVVEDSEAERYFAQAMLAACDEADKIRANSAEILATYDAYVAGIKAKIAATETARREAIENDMIIGETMATEIMACLKQQSRETFKKSVSDMFRIRGSVNSITVSGEYNGRTTRWTLNGRSVKYADAIQAIAKCAEKMYK